MREHRPLVDRSFVGYFADVERWRFGEQDGAADAGRSAAARLREGFEQLRELIAHARVGNDSRRRCIRGQIGRQFAARFDVGNNQRGNVVAIRSGQNHITHQRRAMRDERRAQRPDADPRSGRELEILGDAPVEHQAFGRIVRHPRI